MKYTVVLTENTDGNYQVAVPGLPACTIEAVTRDEAIRKARETISSIISRSEIIQLDVVAEPRTQDIQVDTPWEYFGNFKDNEAWETVFDDIQRQQDRAS